MFFVSSSDLMGRKWTICSVRGEGRSVGFSARPLRCFFVTQEASSVELGTVVQAARGADRKTAADGIRAIIDESSCAVGWCAADQASRSQQFDMARAG
jgi:hypothetical protein